MPVKKREELEVIKDIAASTLFSDGDADDDAATATATATAANDVDIMKALEQADVKPKKASEN